MVTHSPQNYGQIADAGYSLLLAGHTHGGQICLPGGFAPASFSFLPMPYKMMKGLWSRRQMTGYTTRGVGVSGIFVRFFCPGEITVITLKQQKPV
jgi:predicted MPP superfamily phosphohydrolase